MKRMNGKYFYSDRKDGSHVIFNADTMDVFIYRGNIGDFHSHTDNNRISDKETVKRTGVNEMALASLTICVSENCNLACKYCYANGGGYGHAANTHMTFSDMTNMFEKLLEIYPQGIVNYTFFGGEPMIAFDEIVKFVEFVTETSRARDLFVPHFAIVTNGTLITKEAWDFFNKYNFAVTISLDGNKEINDEMRVYLNGKKSVYDTVAGNITTYGNRNFLMVAEATLGAFFFKNYVSGDIENYIKTFDELGFDSVSPFVAETKDLNYRDTQFMNGVESFYHDLVDYYMDMLTSRSRYEKVPSYILSAVVNILLKRSKKTCSAGKESLFYTKSGDVYPCQMYYGDSSNRIANISDMELLKSRIDCKKKIMRNDISECKDCFANRFCTMWCPGGSYMFAGCECGVDPVRCIVQKAIGERIIYRIAEISESDKKAVFVRNIKELSVKYSVRNYVGKRFE